MPGYEKRGDDEEQRTQTGACLRDRSTLREPSSIKEPGHRASIMKFKAELFVEFDQATIRAVHFETDDGNPRLPTCLFGESERFATQAMAAEIRTNVKFVDKGLMASELHDEAIYHD
jgi:hypothetical protein